MPVRGKLVDSPQLIEHGEGMQYYSIKLRLIGNQKRFFLRNCAFEAANEDSILKLQPGTPVELKVLESDYANEQEVNIYAFAIGKQNELLKLDEFNYCHENYWKRLLPFAVLLIGLVVYGLFFNKKK